MQERLCSIMSKQPFELKFLVGHYYIKSFQITKDTNCHMMIIVVNFLLMCMKLNYRGICLSLQLQQLDIYTQCTTWWLSTCDICFEKFVDYTNNFELNGRFGVQKHLPRFVHRTPHKHRMLKCMEHLCTRKIQLNTVVANWFACVHVCTNSGIHSTTWNSFYTPVPTKILHSIHKSSRKSHFNDLNPCLSLRFQSCP